MKILVCVKYVPDATGNRAFTADHLTDRASVDGQLSELDEYAIEQALKIVEGGAEAEIVYLTMGPADASTALRKALSMGGDSAIHVTDDALAGSDGAEIRIGLLVVRGFDPQQDQVRAVDCRLNKTLAATSAPAASSVPSTSTLTLSLRSAAVPFR